MFLKHPQQDCHFGGGGADADSGEQRILMTEGVDWKSEEKISDLPWASRFQKYLCVLPTNNI